MKKYPAPWISRILLSAIVLTTFLFFDEHLHAQSIDSLQQNFSPSFSGITPQTIIAFNVFPNDTANIESVHLTLGTELGNSDIFESSFAIEQLSISANLPHYLTVSAGTHSVIPPFVEVYLVRRNNTQSNTLSKQIIF